MAAAGVRQIVAVPELRGITAAAALGMAGLGLLTVAFPLFAVEHLDAARSDAGYMWAAFAAGSTLGALSLVRIQRRFASERIVIAGYAWPVRWPSGSARRRRCCWRRPPSWWRPASGWP